MIPPVRQVRLGSSREMSGKGRKLVGWLVITLILAALGWLFLQWKFSNARPASGPVTSSRSQVPAKVPSAGLSESLLADYADPTTPPIDDLRKIHRVATGYFSVVKDPARFPIGGNEDFAAALRGENPNLEVFVRAGNPVFSAQGLLMDRWGSPLVIHPEGWRQLEIRSAGPDRIPYNGDDLIVSPTGVSE